MNAIKSWYRLNRLQIIFWSLFFLSIAGSSLPFLRASWGFLGLVGLVPLLLFIDFTARHTSTRQRILYIALIGFGAMLCVLFWSLQTMPERWAYIDGWSAVVGLYINYFLFASIFSLNFLFFGVVYSFLRPGLYRKSSFVVLPALWVVSEYLRSFIFSIASYGKGGSIGAYWNWGTPGLATATTWFGYGGRIVGLYGLTFLTVALSLSVVWLIRRRTVKPLLIVGGLCILLAGAGYKLYQPTQVTKTVAFVQTPPRFDDTPSQDRFLAQTISQAQNKQIDVLVLPEHADLYGKQSSPEFQTSINAALSSNGVIVTSRLTNNSAAAVNQLRIYNNQLQPIYDHDKSYLIPISEYMPFVHKVFVTAMGQKEALALNRERLGVVKTDQPIPAVPVPGLILGPQVCSGAVTPSLFQRQVREGAQVLTNSASISMFSQAPTYQEQNKQFAHFMSLANARPYVQAAEGGHGSILDTQGRVVVGNKSFGYEFGMATVPLVQKRTPYSMLGEWVVGISAAITVVLIVFNTKHMWYSKENIRNKNGHTKKPQNHQKGSR